MMMPNITLSFTTSAFIVALLAVIAVAVSIYFYRHTVPPIPRSKKITLIVLRSIALTLLLVFLFEPLLRFVSTSTQKPVLAVLVDDSKSMSIKDKTGDRAEILKTFLTKKGFKNATDEIRIYSFGTRTQQVDAGTIDSLRIDEGATDITAALRKVGEEKERSNIGATLLISDGSYNLGQNPLYEADEFGIPLFTVGIGDSTEQKDVLITKVLTNELVYNQTEVPVDVTIKSSGFKGEKVEVILAEGSRDLSRAQITLEEGTREYAARLSYTPEGDGIKKYSVRVSKLPGELTTAN
ncbi:MAG: vWA domain-containing protein, partial [bacterium]